MKLRPRLALLAASLCTTLGASACLTGGGAASGAATAAVADGERAELAPLFQPTFVGSPDVAVSAAPYDTVHVNWKHRLDQPYVFVEHTGDYRKVGDAVREVARLVAAGGVEPTGALFCLYYDDPGAKPLEMLRARACVPVRARSAEGAGLAYDVLPSTTVAYAVVAGPAWDVPRSYPALFEYLERHGWREDGPVREIYLNVDSIEDPAGLLTEVQVPWTAGE